MNPRSLQPFSLNDHCFLVSMAVQQWLKALGIPSRIIRHNLYGDNTPHSEVVFMYEDMIRVYDSNGGTSQDAAPPGDIGLEGDPLKTIMRFYHPIKFDKGEKKVKPSARWLTGIVE